MCQKKRQVTSFRARWERPREANDAKQAPEPVCMSELENFTKFYLGGLFT